MIIQTLYLGVTLGNQLTFAMFDGSINPEFGFVNPHITNGFFGGRKGYEIPSMVGF